MGGRPLRILTAVAPYDGHDVSVLALNRALLAGPRPVEVIYLGFNMRGEQISAAALQEGADAVAVSSYNGGHLQFYPHLLRLLGEGGAPSPLLFGGGGGTILPEDIAALEAAGVARIYGPGRPLDAVAADLLACLREKGAPAEPEQPDAETLAGAGAREPAALSRLFAFAEARWRNGSAGGDTPEGYRQFLAQGAENRTPVVAVTGEGGAGKSTLIDELVLRLRQAFPEKNLAVLANDPTLDSGGGRSALLADRVRMNAVYDQRVLMRSVATGAPYLPLSPALAEMAALLRASRFDLVLVETPGTGQAGIDLSLLGADLVLYLKTREYGGGLQLEKDQLLREADLVVLNKVDLPGSESAFAELGALLARLGREGTLHGVMTKTTRDPGVDRLFAELCGRLDWPPPAPPAGEEIFRHARRAALVPHGRRTYLAEIVRKIRDYDRWTAGQLALVRQDPGHLGHLDPRCRQLLEGWPQRWQELSARAAEKLGTEPWTLTPNGLRLPRVALPDPADRAESLRFLLEEGLPGDFPFATGIYPLRTLSAGETTRQFAGLRGPEETNQRLHLLNRGVARPRLSIAFDGPTLYGADSDEDPGSIGKIGEGGVSIDSYEDMKLVLRGFDIAEISTSMTINGPAPILLAMYFVAAQELEEERAAQQLGRPLAAAERAALRRQTLGQLRGTLQADILKEVQAQNECIFQPDFAIRLLGDIQEYFVANDVRRFYSLSISGYHIGEAGASPIQELAFTLANGFTYVEHFLARGLAIDAFAPQLSFFFKVSHEAEWLAYGAVCRKIWAVAMRDVYGGNERSQRFKFHTQTSGRALQAEEWDTLNPLRQTYHALLGLLANANSLHVDAADEPMTTPGEKYVRQAALIPGYLREEAEAFVIQNLLSGSYAFRTLMREVQEGILAEFERLDQLGGVGPATEQGYQRRCIAENSARYERERCPPTPEHPAPPLRPIIGYNVHTLPAGHPDRYPRVSEVIRPGPEDWARQLSRVRDFRRRHEEDAPLYLQRLKAAALGDGNVFAELLETVRHATIGEITRTLFEVGGRYRKMV
jgi:methylmalonyl-CoA mutase